MKKVTAKKQYKSNTDEIKLVRKQSDFKKVKVTSSNDAEAYARQFYQDDITIYESMFLMLMNRSNNITAWVKISQGGISGTVVDIKLILKYAIDTLSSGIILAHNHPSGNKQASNGDINITKKLKEAAKLMDISLLDHIILTEESCTSLSEEGYL